MTLPTLLAAAATLAAARAPIRCPENERPELTGRLLAPVTCEPKAAAAPAEAPLEAELPDTSDVGRADLKPLSGKWRGVVTAQGAHYELALEVSSSGRGWSLSSTELRGLSKLRLRADLKTGFLRAKKQPYEAEVDSPDYPERSLKALVWAGAAKPENGKRPELDRLVVWTYAERPETHRVQFALDGNKVRGDYTVVDPKAGPTTVQFELTR